MPAFATVYVGGLRADVTQRDVEDEFLRFGRIDKIWIARNPPGFAFIDYEDYRDAEDAVRRLDGAYGWKVEISRSRGPGSAGFGRSRGDMACFVCGELGHLARDCRGGPPRRPYSPPRGMISPGPSRRFNRSPPRRGYDSPFRRGYDSPPRRRSRSPPPRGRARSRSLSPFLYRRSRSLS